MSVTVEVFKYRNAISNNEILFNFNNQKGGFVDLTANKGKPNTSLTVIKCFKVLQVVAEHSKKLGRDGPELKDIAAQAGYDSATTYRYLQSLQEYGLVQKTRNGQYKLGLKVVELYHLFSNSNDLREIAYELMLALTEQTKETVYLGLIDGDEVFYLERVDSPLPIRPHTQIGGRNGLYYTGLGKAMLAFADESLVRSVLESGLHPRTPNTIVDPKQLLEELVLIRQQGYAVDNLESEAEVRCVSAPIVNGMGEVYAAISISGPAFRVTEERVADLAEKVKEAARKVSQELGCADYQLSLKRSTATTFEMVSNLN